MYYIIGTTFKIDNLNFKLIKKYAPLSEGIYKINYIRKNNNLVEYTVINNIGKKFVLNFNNCKEADNLISSLKNEKLPVLESAI